MRSDVFFVVLALLFVQIQARGPLCLDCLAVESPHKCTRVTECGQDENCDSDKSLRQRSEFRLCDTCCHGDLCNNNVCTNGKAPPSGIPCLECSGVLSVTECNQLTYCQEEEVCYTQQHSHNAKFNMGCLPKKECGVFEAQSVDKWSQKEGGVSCNKCCGRPGCNYDICTEDKESATIPVETTAPTIGIVRDCLDVLTLLDKTVSGYYQVTLNGSSIMVYCDMETDGGGWTVFQRRYNGTVSFDRTYDEYSQGFGNSSEFWLGNEKLHLFTSERSQTLRIDMCRFDGSSYYAKYMAFYIGPATDKFRLSLMGYSGDAGDALLPKTEYGTHNGQYFSAGEMDNDRSSSSCASDFSSGWWFNDCYNSNLNGVYRKAAHGDMFQYKTPTTPTAEGTNQRDQPKREIPQIYGAHHALPNETAPY